VGLPRRRGIFLHHARQQRHHLGIANGNWSSLNTAASGSVTDKVFTLYINHGIGFTGLSYGYIAVPGIAASSMSNSAVAAAMDAYLASNPITVLTSNADSNVQGVYQSTLHMTQASFYAGGETLTMNTGACGVVMPSAMILRSQYGS
jgi:chondroitin AC lyase